MRGREDAPFENLLKPWIQDPTLVEELSHYGQLLERWSRIHNLVSFSTRKELVERHLVECAAGAVELESRGRLLDVGSGAGLPGVPLLLARRSWQGVLLEPREKRWSFLRLVIRELGLDCEAVCSRLEDWDRSDSFDLICARAVGNYSAMLAPARRLLKPTGQVLLWLGKETPRDLRDPDGWRVLSSPLAAPMGGRLTKIQPCFT